MRLVAVAFRQLLLKHNGCVVNDEGVPPEGLHSLGFFCTPGVHTFSSTPDPCCAQDLARLYVVHGACG